MRERDESVIPKILDQHRRRPSVVARAGSGDLRTAAGDQETSGEPHSCGEPATRARLRHHDQSVPARFRRLLGAEPN